MPRRLSPLTLVLLAGVFLGFVPSHASAVGTGSISGTLTGSSSQPLEKVCVNAYDTNGQAVSFDSSDSDGDYMLPGLETADYRVGFKPCGDANVLDEFYEDKATLAEATPVPVTNGSDTPGIDARLARGGSISGKVTVEPNGPDGLMCVRAWNSRGDDWSGTVADSSGNYSIVGLRTGVYRVQFVACDFASFVISEFYYGRKDLARATLVPVAAGSDTPDINARLTTGGRISGVVVSGLSVAAEVCSMTVTAYDAGGSVAGSYNFSAYAGGAVGYTIDRLGTGAYRLGFTESCMLGPPSYGTASASGFYNGKESFAQATPVSVTEGSSRTGINMFAGGGGMISGLVTDIDGRPLSDVCIQTYDGQGNLGSEGRTSADGTYLLNQFSTGTYRLKFSDCVDGEPTNLIPEFYDDKATLAEAIPVSVEYGNETSGIDVQLARTTFPIPGMALISKVRVMGPVKLGKGRKTVYGVRITNSGTTGARGVALRVRGRGVSFNTSVGGIPAGTTRTVKARLKPRKSGKVRLTFRVTSSNAGGKNVARGVIVGG